MEVGPRWQIPEDPVEACVPAFTWQQCRMQANRAPKRTISPQMQANMPQMLGSATRQACILSTCGNWFEGLSLLARTAAGQLFTWLICAEGAPCQELLLRRGVGKLQELVGRGKLYHVSRCCQAGAYENEA